MDGTCKLMDEASHLILHRTPMEEVKKGITIIIKGEGIHVIDQLGKSYMDFESGGTRPVHVGYGRKEMAQAVYDQICELPYFTPMQFANVPALKLAEVLAEITPGSINKFIFECDGSEAVESAMKIAKHYHYYRGERGRFKVISRKGAYHGVNGMAVRALGTVIAMRQMMEPVAPGGVLAESPYCYRCPFNLTYPTCDIACARNVRQIVEFEGPEYISAFIGEPIQQGFGAFRPPTEYWPIVREICDTYGIILIIDEVICGFGRTGKMFGIEHFGIQPDIITMAKGITSGYLPLGAVGCTNNIVEPIKVFSHLHTYGNHPVPCAAALRNIEIIRKEKLVENSQAMGRYLLEGLKTLEYHSIVGESRGTGLWAALDFTTDKKTHASFPLSGLQNMIARAKSKGLLIKSMGQALEFAPPLIIQKDDIDKALRIIDEVITEEEKRMGL